MAGRSRPKHAKVRDNQPKAHFASGLAAPHLQPRSKHRCRAIREGREKGHQGRQVGQGRHCYAAAPVSRRHHSQNWTEAQAALRQYYLAPNQNLHGAQAARGGACPDRPQNLRLLPRPAPVVADIVEAAEIEPGMSVLEPSAGKGNIADAIRESHPDAKLDTVEYQRELGKILEIVLPVTGTVIFG